MDKQLTSKILLSGDGCPGFEDHPLLPAGLLFLLVSLEERNPGVQICLS
jgi:hypothetical protein